MPLWTRYATIILCAFCLPCAAHAQQAPPAKAPTAAAPLAGASAAAGSKEAAVKLPKAHKAAPQAPAATVQEAATQLWLESGLGYRRDYADSSASLSPLPRGGVRLTHELWPRKSLYLAAAYDGAVTVDAGGWFGFAPKATDLYGFNAAMGAGVSYVGGAWGATLSAAVRYELLPDVDLQLVYTHRPIFFPELSQAFDVSLGVGFDLAAPEPLAEPTPPQRAP